MNIQSISKELLVEVSKEIPNKEQLRDLLPPLLRENIAVAIIERNGYYHIMRSPLDDEKRKVKVTRCLDGMGRIIQKPDKAPHWTQIDELWLNGKNVYQRGR